MGDSDSESYNVRQTIIPCAHPKILKMACIEKSHWADTKIIFKNAVTCSKSKETRALFLLLSSPFILTKNFPENKLKTWAIKCGIIRKNNLSNSETCNMTMDYMDFVTNVVSTFCLLMEMMDTDARETSKKLKPIRSLDSGIEVVLGSPVYHHIRAMLPYKNNEKKFPGLITILVYMYDNILYEIEDPMRLDRIFQLSDKAESFRLQGNDLFKSQKFKAAIESYTLAIKESPYTALLYSNRSVAHLKIKSNQQALRDARLALMINPMWPKVYYRLAEVIEHAGCANDAFEAIEDGLRHCAVFNLTGKEVEQIEKFKSILRPKVKMNLWSGNENSPVTLTDNQSPILIKDDFDADKLESTQDLIRNYSILLEKALNAEFKIKDEEIYMLKLCLSLALSKNGNQEDLNKSLCLAESLVADSSHRYKQLGYFIIASVLYQLFRFRECRVNAEEGNRMFADGEYDDEALCWVNSDSVPIEITLPGRLRKGFESFLRLCENPIPPIATCRFVSFSEDLKQKLHVYPEIYEQEPEYKGYVQLTCTQKCSLQYHAQCWKYLKENHNKSNDKAFLGTPCLTPDCSAAIFRVYLVNKDQSKNKVFELSKEEALKKLKLEQKIKINNNNDIPDEPKKSKKNNNTSNSSKINMVNGDINPSSSESHRPLNAVENTLILEMQSKIESLSQQVNQVKQEAKESKSEVESHKSFMDKLKAESKKFQEEVKAFKNEQKAWKTERLKFEQDFSTQQSSMELMSAVLDNERTCRQEMAALLNSTGQRCEEAKQQSNACQISCLRMKRDLGSWILNWAMLLSEHKVSQLLNNSSPEEIVKITLSELQDLSDKKQAFQISIDDYISNLEKGNHSGSLPEVPIPVKMESLSKLLTDALNANQNVVEKENEEKSVSQPISSMTSSSASPEPNGPVVASSSMQPGSNSSYFNHHTSYFANSLKAAENFHMQVNQNPKYVQPEYDAAVAVAAADDLSDNNESSSIKSFKSNSTSLSSDFCENNKALESAIYCKNLEDSMLSKDINPLGAIGKQSRNNNNEPEWKGAGNQVKSDDLFSREFPTSVDDLADINSFNQRSVMHFPPAAKPMKPSMGSLVGAMPKSSESNDRFGRPPTNSALLPEPIPMPTKTPLLPDPISKPTKPPLISDPLPVHIITPKPSAFPNNITAPPSASNLHDVNAQSNEEDKKWKVVGERTQARPFSLPSNSTKVPHGANKLSQRQKLIAHLKNYFTDYSEEELDFYLKEVRRSNNNTLTRLTFEKIRQKVCELIALQKSGTGMKNNEMSSFGVPKPTPAAPWLNAQKGDVEWQPDCNFHMECIICQEDMSPITCEQLDCGHLFHKMCIKAWFKEQKSCPVCRKLALSKDDFPKLK